MASSVLHWVVPHTQWATKPVTVFHFCSLSQMFTECTHVPSTGLGMSKTEITPVIMEDCLVRNKHGRTSNIKENRLTILISAVKEKHMKY